MSPEAIKRLDAEALQRAEQAQGACVAHVARTCCCLCSWKGTRVGTGCRLVGRVQRRRRGPHPSGAHGLAAAAVQQPRDGRLAAAAGAAWGAVQSLIDDPRIEVPDQVPAAHRQALVRQRGSARTFARPVDRCLACRTGTATFEMVTFDRGFRSYSKLKLRLLEPAAADCAPEGSPRQFRPAAGERTHVTMPVAAAPSSATRSA